MLFHIYQLKNLGIYWFTIFLILTVVWKQMNDLNLSSINKRSKRMLNKEGYTIEEETQNCFRKRFWMLLLSEIQTLVASRKTLK